jgi:hypothetical protein
MKRTVNITIGTVDDGTVTIHSMTIERAGKQIAVIKNSSLTGTATFTFVEAGLKTRIVVWWRNLTRSYKRPDGTIIFESVGEPVE